MIALARLADAMVVLQQRRYSRSVWHVSFQKKHETVGPISQQHPTACWLTSVRIMDVASLRVGSVVSIRHMFFLKGERGMRDDWED